MDYCITQLEVEATAAFKAIPHENTTLKISPTIMEQFSREVAVIIN